MTATDCFTHLIPAGSPKSYPCGQPGKFTKNESTYRKSPSFPSLNIQSNSCINFIEKACSIHDY